MSSLLHTALSIKITNTPFFPSCVNTIQDILCTLTPPPHSIDISVVLQSVRVQHDPELGKETIELAIENAGFDIGFSTPKVSRVATKQESFSQSTSSLFAVKQRKHVAQCSFCQSGKTHVNAITEVPISEGVQGVPKNSKDPTREEDPVALTLSIGGMTCAACSNTLTRLLSEVDGVSKAVVDLISHSARIVVKSQKVNPAVIETIEDAGFDAEIVRVEPLAKGPAQETAARTISLQVDGMHCG